MLIISLLIGVVIFISINVYAFSNGILIFNNTAIIFEIIFFWLCLGPQLMAHFFLKASKYQAAYEELKKKYNKLQKEKDDLEFNKTIFEQRNKKKVEESTKAKDVMIEQQFESLKEMTEQRNAYKQKYIETKKRLLELEGVVQK